MSGPSEGALLANCIFGVRHLSPAAAFHLERWLERERPAAVVLEAPAGAEEQLRHLVHPDTEPPVALLAFTSQRPVRTFFYPLASYSPEWIAVRWAVRHGAELRCMDLPADVFLGLAKEEEEAHHLEQGSLKLDQETARSPLEALAEQLGAPDVETFWEREFEHIEDGEAYRAAAFALGEGLRSVEKKEGFFARENLLREAYMRRTLLDVRSRHPASAIAVVCGAFHAPVLREGLEAMDDAALQTLPREPASLTLMPYSYERLHRRAGYGAGNRAPRYHARLHAHLLAGTLPELGAEILSDVAQRMRISGYYRASSQVIDAVRLSCELAALSESAVVTLRDLRDAAVTCLGAGEPAGVLDALDAVETGSAVGRLPPGVARTALQDDFHRELARLKLDPYLLDRESVLELDVRENTRAATPETALRDRNRSIFLRRLRTTRIPFATLRGNPGGLHASWKETWSLRWQAESEVKLAELSLLGDSVAGAASYLLSERLDQGQGQGAGSAAEVLLESIECDLGDSLEAARSKVQAAAVQDTSLPSLALATEKVVQVTRFGGVRAVDPEPLWPLIAQLFLRATLLIPTEVRCDAKAKESVAQALLRLDAVSAQVPSRLDVERFAQTLHALARADDGNAYLLGLITSMLLQRQQLTEAEMGGALGRRLLPGESPERAGEFFEGLCRHNRMGLLSRDVVWEKLTTFVDALEGADLLSVLVPLRRTFGAFSKGELRSVALKLAQLWKGSRTELLATVESPLAPEQLAQLNDALGGLEDLDL